MGPVSTNLHELLHQSGTGDHRAFSELYHHLAPAILVEAWEQVHDPVHAQHVLQATFCEIWQMARCRTRHGVRSQDIAGWARTVAAQRGRERREALELIARSPDGIFWLGLLSDQDSTHRAGLYRLLRRDAQTVSSGRDRSGSPS